MMTVTLWMAGFLFQPNPLSSQEFTAYFESEAMCEWAIKVVRRAGGGAWDHCIKQEFHGTPGVQQPDGGQHG